VDAFLFGLPIFVIVMSIVLPGHLSQHAKAATAEGLTFSDTIHKKSARNLNLYNFCHSPKKLAAVSPFSSVLFLICKCGYNQRPLVPKKVPKKR
jgi:hypothetical protein